MCEHSSGSGGKAAGLHAAVCRLTHGIPCKAAHSVGAAFGRLIGKPAPEHACCGAQAQADSPPSACQGHAQQAGAQGCGCGKKNASDSVGG